MPNTLHECGTCINGEIFAVFNCSFQIELLQFLNFSVEYEKNEKICDCYYSFDFNDFGFTTCPHKAYKITVKVVDRDNTPVPNSQIVCDNTYTVLNGDMIENDTNTFTTDDKGTVSVYLKNGNYSIKVERDGTIAQRTIKVNSKSMTKKLKLGSFEGPFDNGVRKVAEVKVGDNVYYRSYDNGIAVLEGIGPTWYRDALSEEDFGTEKILIVEEGVTRIEHFLFQHHPTLEKVYISDSVDEIGSSSFSDCPALEYVRMSENVDFIGGYAFANCEKLSTVTSLACIRKLHNNVFTGCISLKNIEIPETCTEIEQLVFEGSSINTVIIPKKVKYVSQSSLANCDELENVYILNNFKIVYGVYDNMKDKIFGDTLEHEINIYYVSEAEETFNALKTVYGDKVIGHLIEEDDVPNIYNISQENMVENEITSTDLEIKQDPSFNKLVLQENAINNVNLLQMQITENEFIQTSQDMIGEEHVFDNLFAGEEYLFCIIKDESLENVFTPENIVYIDQATANEQGKVSFAYNLENETEDLIIKLYGKKKVQAIDLDITQINLNVGETDEIRYTITPEDGYTQNLKWISSDENVVTVQEDGTINAVGTGTATITITIDDVSSECEIIVNDKYIKGDINGDGKINIKDWNMLYRYINETIEFDENQLERADINGDGKVNIKDWNRLYNHITEVDPLL